MSGQKRDLTNLGCQMQSIPKIKREVGPNGLERLPLINHIRLFFRRHLSLNARRQLKKYLRLNYLWRNDRIQGGDLANQTSFKGELLNLKAGEMVRVRSKEEILATLNTEGKLKGCSFLNVMLPYCGTIQKVFKPVVRFVDERDYKIKNACGIVLLEDVMCTGTEFYGNCDRSCLFFWREEWLERA
jgi:hypothetical protein